MNDAKAMIERFLAEMRNAYGEQIDAVALPEGTLEYVRERADDGDADTLVFMLKLGYLMGLQTGYAAGVRGDSDGSDPTGRPGPLQA